jgi:hypothetical protein
MWARDKHLPRFSDGEALCKKAEAEEARERRGAWSRRSRGSPSCSTSHAQWHEEELEEASGGGYGGAARPPD